MAAALDAPCTGSTSAIYLTVWLACMEFDPFPCPSHVTDGLDCCAPTLASVEFWSHIPAPSVCVTPRLLNTILKIFVEDPVTVLGVVSVVPAPDDQHGPLAPYISVKFRLALLKADRIVSPVWSLGAAPMFIVCWLILLAVVGCYGCIVCGVRSGIYSYSG